MNDRYLYRAKQKSDKKWIYGNLIQTDDGVYIIQNYVPQHLIGKYEIDPSTICQFTGLKDKNGKLIWENDIVHNGNYFVVKWNLSCARFDFALNNSHNIPVGRWEPMIIDWKNSDFKEYRNNIDFEVIGNIFDNPELLGVGE